MTTPSHQHDKHILPKLGHQIVHLYDWLSGPAMSEQERIHRELAETEAIRRMGSYGL